MSAFKKGDKEYVSNGNYSMNGERFMSVWSYKKDKGIEPNTNSVNGKEGIELSAKNITIYESEPDFGNFGMVYLYPYAVLEEFYS